MIALILATVLIAASWYDMLNYHIPDWLTFPAIAAGLVLTQNWLGALTGALCMICVGCLGLAILKQETIGGGDVRLMAVVGSFLGCKIVLLSFFIAPLFALLYGRMYARKKKELPYAPAISLAAGVSYLWASFIF